MNVIRIICRKDERNRLQAFLKDYSHLRGYFRNLSSSADLKGVGLKGVRSRILNSILSGSDDNEQTITMQKQKRGQN